uniref:ShKT domain-containing protein n=1 Tax=Clytia hemisphaerica TaxID=252671 RepID=A0A7M5XGY2_9CNID
MNWLTICLVAVTYVIVAKSQVCIDSSRRCVYWSRYCRTSTYVALQCRRTCGRCLIPRPRPVVPSRRCFDIDRRYVCTGGITAIVEDIIIKIDVKKLVVFVEHFQRQEYAWTETRDVLFGQDAINVSSIQDI